MAENILGKVFMTPVGEWNFENKYEKLDIVTVTEETQSSAYIAKEDISENTEILNEKWMKLFTVKDGSTLEIDKTLTQENKAADAKVVGDELKKIKPSLSYINHGTNDTTFELPSNEYHKWDEVTELNITLKAPDNEEIINEYYFSFISGETATTLYLPESIITDIVVQPNTRYEISIIDNYMVYMDWSV